MHRSDARWKQKKGNEKETYPRRAITVIVEHEEINQVKEPQRAREYRLDITAFMDLNVNQYYMWNP